MRGVSWSAPNCTVSSVATSNETIRPVILSRPEKTAVGFLIRSALHHQCRSPYSPLSFRTLVRNPDIQNGAYDIH